LSAELTKRTPSDCFFSDLGKAYSWRGKDKKKESWKTV